MNRTRAILIVGALVCSSLLAPLSGPGALEFSSHPLALVALPHVQSQRLGTILPKTSCRVFPVNNVWNTPIKGLPVNTNSATWLAAMAAATTNLHPDYGPSSNPQQPYGIPWQLVPSHTAFTRITFLYASESDRRLYPLNARTPIEGGSDRHALMLDPRASPTSKPCTLFETYDTHFQSNGRSTADSGAVWNLNSNALRPSGFTSADAAGLPILPGLVNYDEVASTSLNHAIRFTAQCTQRSYLWPARHEAGQANSNCPPMGARFRLSASFTLPSSACSAFCQRVINAMKTYGLILADNGSNWYFQGTADTRWTGNEVNQLKQIPASAFVAVDESCLMVNADSGQARQPGTAAYSQNCG
ncbi:MAG TPA: hypothetical protein VII65_04875 [Acidimicrobiales bacterium]